MGKSLAVRSRSRGITASVIVALAIILAPRVFAQEAAIDMPAYRGELVSQSHATLNLLPGRAFTVTADIKNTGTETWTSTGPHFVALNVTEPAGRTSLFRHTFWNEYPYRPTRLKQATVAPGEIAQFRFALQAPKTIAPGTYSEHFALVAEDLLWIPNAGVTIIITVPEAYTARLTAVSEDTLTLNPGQEKTIWADFKNTGAKTWKNKGTTFVALNVAEPAGRESQFYHRFWRASYRPNRLNEESVAHGEIGRMRIAIKAPLIEGDYVEQFGLVAEDLLWIPGGTVQFPIRVERKPVVLPGITGPGPTVRVGLYEARAAVVVTADGPWVALDANGATLKILAATDTATVAYDPTAKTYALTAAGETFSSSVPIRLAPANDSVILTIESYKDPLGWRAADPYKRYRGIIEVRFADATGKLWVINELPLESYLAGIAEAGNENPDDYLRALLVAARSFAIRIWTLGTKHADENYTLDATYDQVYRGYTSELERPNIVRAVAETRGEAVTFGGRVVLTPYFSHSDGRTRAWEEVWGGGPYPWLVSVPDPCCTTKRLFGHGVGMSALGARYFALQGKTYRDILQHYYPGTGLETVY